MCKKISQIRVNYVKVLIPIVSGVKERALPYFSLIFDEMDETCPITKKTEVDSLDGLEEFRQ